MTYEESYRKFNNIEDAKEQVKKDIRIAWTFGGNPDRLKAIEDALNRVAKEKGWIN